MSALGSIPDYDDGKDRDPLWKLKVRDLIAFWDSLNAVPSDDSLPPSPTALLLCNRRFSASTATITEEFVARLNQHINALRKEIE